MNVDGFTIRRPDLAREAYERHMRKLHHVPRLAYTALATGALRPRWMEA